MTDASGEVTGSSGAAQRVLVRAATALVTSAALLAPGPLVGQAACTTEEGPMVEEMRETYREIAELRDSVEAILDREDALDSVGKIMVVTDLDEMETDIGFVDFDPPERAVYRIRGLLAEHFAGRPPEERNVSVDLEAPVVKIEGDRVESCAPVAANDGHISELLREVGETYQASTDARIPGGTARAVLWLFVDWRGQVAEVRFQGSSGDEWLDEAFAATAREMEFEPATVEGTPIGVWVTRELTINAP